jgi:hypothetical protein
VSPAIDEPPSIKADARVARSDGRIARIGCQAAQGRSRLRQRSEGDGSVRILLSLSERELTFPPPTTSLFGPKTVSLKPILRLLPKIFAHADKTVRLEGAGLALALHAYLGPALDSHLTELKPVQVKELGEAFAAADAKGEGFGAVKQTRFTRSQQRERDVKEAEGALEGTNGEDAGEYSFGRTLRMPPLILLRSPCSRRGS